MEVYVLDSLLRRTTVVDVYESLIWTERFTAFGDFELYINSTPATRRLFTPGTRFAINNSYRVMTVETVEDDTDSGGKDILSLKGSSLESVLDDRVVKKTLSNLVAEPNWVITDKPKNVMNTMFDSIVRTASLNPGDAIPFLQPGSIFPADTIPDPADPITWTQEPASLYSAMKTVGELYGLGFRLVRNFDMSQLYFDVYSGSDRTTNQSLLAPVVFSSDLENVQNTKKLTSISGSKNVAYVFSNQGYAIVYGRDADGTASGFDRNVLMVKADDLPNSPTPAQVTLYLTQKGQEALSQNQPFSAFDGETSQYSQYKYGTHYNLGDLVELRDGDGGANQMRVTEQIFVSDKEGERSYPTLSLVRYVNPGSWLSWAANQTWADLDPNPTTWSQQA